MNKSTKFLLYGGLLALLVSAIFNIVSLVRFGASPQIDNLKFVNDSLNNSITNLTIRMQAEKESYNAQIDSIINNSENVTQKERAVAQREKDLLNETIREQQFCIDSLRRVIRTIQRQTGVCRQESVIVGKDEKDGMSALQLAGYCIDVFNAFKNAKETAKASLLENSKALSAKLNAYKDDVIETLSILDKKTEGKYIKEIRVILHDLNRSKYFKPETVIWKSDNNRGVYTSLDAKKLIDKFIIPTLEKIVDAEK